jgi:hypothetical protein
MGIQYSMYDRVFDLTLDTITCPVSCRSSSSMVHDCFQRNVRGLLLTSQKIREIVNSALGTVPLIKLDRAVVVPRIGLL